MIVAESRKKGGLFSLPKRSFAVLAIVLLASSCAKKRVDPYALPILPEDRVTAEFAPTEEELVPVPQRMLLLAAAGNEAASQNRLERILAFVRSGMGRYGNIRCVPQRESEDVLREEEFRLFRPESISEVVRLGKRVEARFATQLRVAVRETESDEEPDRLVADIDLTVVATGSGRTVFKENLKYDSARPQRSLKTIGKPVQRHFPIKGFILETRGGRQVAKISVGRSLGVELNRLFHVRERFVAREVVRGAVRKSIDYSREVVAPVRVIRVMENESWVSVPEGRRSKVMLGQVLFSQPERN